VESHLTQDNRSQDKPYHQQMQYSQLLQAQIPQNQFLCRLQNRLGAMDRILGALTHRGMVPLAFESNLYPETDEIQVKVTVSCEEEKKMEKLLKFLANQVYVLQVTLLEPGVLVPLPVKATGNYHTAAFSTSPVTNPLERKYAHANPS
jgi:acetolactate synthase regulatory subunit